MSSTRLLTEDTICHSYLNEKKFNFKWIIHKYSSSNLKTGASFCSSPFTFYCNPNTKISGHLECYPKGYDDTNHVCIAIRKVSYIKQVEADKVSIKILLLKEEEIYRQGSINLREDKDLFRMNIITHKELNEETKSLLPDDNLTILCEIKYVECKSNMIPKNITFDRIESKLNNDLVSFFENGKHCDVTLVADEHELHAHKGILASRSDVFAAMFEHEMEESKSNRVIITDCNPEVLKEMLRYIYTGKAQNLNKMATELLKVCDKYGLENLKYMCEDELGRLLSIDTVAETLLLADLYRCNELKEHAIHFMKTHAAAVTKTAGWKKLVNDHFDLIAEVYLQLVN